MGILAFRFGLAVHAEAAGRPVVGKVPRVAFGDRHHRMALLRVPFRRTPSKPQAMDNASDPSRRGRLGSRNFGGPQSGTVLPHGRRPLPLDFSSSSSPIRANTHLIGWDRVTLHSERLSAENLLFRNDLPFSARLPPAPERRGETERKASLAGSHSL